jgi:uroporphyrinogen-III decarboxylase
MSFPPAKPAAKEYLPHAEPRGVTQPLRRCGIFAESDGFVFSSIHNVQANTPVDNIVAMRDAVAEINRSH